jgi:hypothetical protein
MLAVCRISTFECKELCYLKIYKWVLLLLVFVIVPCT